MALAVSAIGVAGLYLSLSAGFAALIALVCYGGCAVLLAGSSYRSVELAIAGRWRQIGALGAAALLGALAYAAFRGHFSHATYFGETSATAMGRFFGHDALATGP
jgi:NADH:ubiquinone oxidoreductase subunit 6 (subunit J)